MHIVLEPNLFLERIDKLFSLWQDLKGRKLQISTSPYGRVFFKCDPQSLDIPAKIIEEGEVLVEAESAQRALAMYSRIDNVEIFTRDSMLIIKQRNFTMNLLCISDDDVRNYADALSSDRLVMLKIEKRRLQAEIRRIDKEIASRRGGMRVNRRLR